MQDERLTHETPRSPRRRGRVTRTAAMLALAAVVLHGAAVAASAAPVDLNTASAAELEALPGIGAAKAAAIVEERQVRPFADVDDLERVRGIGPALLAELRSQVTVAAPKKAQ